MLRTGPNRRSVLASALAAGAALALRRRDAAGQDSGLPLGKPQPFSFAWLTDHARALAREAYVPPPQPAPEVIRAIDYDAHGKLRTRPDLALWGRTGGVFPITFVHQGRYFPKTVRLHAIESGTAREILYSRELFTVPEDHVARMLPPDASAFAGFWVQETRRAGSWSNREPWVTFSGASYFRAVGEREQVGMSARGIALNVADPTPEEFPDFTHFWFEPTQSEGDPQIVYALLDGPSITGAYRFAMRRTRAVIMDVECRLFMRQDVGRLGIAPLTSMFWYAEYPNVHPRDWRPEVHDSDGLAMWTGRGERIWRPLNNPARIVTSSFFDENPRGFGLSQRDREYPHYLDGVRYHDRPSCWVEPLTGWGRGAVQLVELPTDDEIYDNIVVYWLPERPARAGDEIAYSYRLHWVEFEPFFPILDLARCTATRVGRGGELGKTRPVGVHKLAIEFDGGVLGKIPWGARPIVVATASRGIVSQQRAEPIFFTPRWLATFDLAVDGSEPAELRCFLELDGKALTETWMAQWHPAAHS